MSRVIRTYSVILVFTSLAYLVRWASGQFEPEFNFILFIGSIILISVTWEFLRWVNDQLNKIFPFEKGIPRRIAIQLAIGAAFALTIRLLIYEFGEPYLSFKLDKMFIAATWVLYVMASAIINSVFFTWYFIDRWKDSLVQAERLEKEKSQVQFDNLKNQLNPHFLFNAFLKFSHYSDVN